LKAPVIGQVLRWDDDAGKTHDVTVVGIVNDFHFTSLHESIKPFGFILEVGNGSTFFLKLASPDLPFMLREVENVWTKHQPEKPFQYAFQDEQMARLHIAERQFHQLFSSFTLLAIVIACLGLLGLVTALAESRTKEIGIRKVLGSSVMGIVQLLSKEFIGLVLVALAIAVPVAWITSSSWLDTFAYHITVSWKTFLLAGGYTLLIVLATIGMKAVRAALANPVESLRNE
jgi:putative ABC transport system permease protein